MAGVTSTFSHWNNFYTKFEVDWEAADGLKGEPEPTERIILSPLAWEHLGIIQKELEIVNIWDSDNQMMLNRWVKL